MSVIPDFVLDQQWAKRVTQLSLICELMKRDSLVPLGQVELS